MTLQQSSKAEISPVSRKASSTLLTLFTVLKPFKGEAARHQRNAIASWKALGPQVQVILASDSDIPDDLCVEFECYRCKRLNGFGTPQLDEVFAVAATLGRGRARAFVNADILLDSRFVDATRRLLESEFTSWLAFGQRTELKVDDSVDENCERWIADCFQAIRTNGKLDSIVCKDYFIFPSHLFLGIPPFAIGRGNWDSWMVSHSKATGNSVVDITAVAPVIHQQHAYGHVSGGRLSAYVSGPEARENQRLAGGRNLISGSTPQWKLTKNGLQRLRFGNVAFGRDFIRFGLLLCRLLWARLRRNKPANAITIDASVRKIQEKVVDATP